jgi:hypothetical protein
MLRRRIGFLVSTVVVMTSVLLPSPAVQAADGCNQTEEVVLAARNESGTAWMTPKGADLWTTVGDPDTKQLGSIDGSCVGGYQLGVRGDFVQVRMVDLQGRVTDENIRVGWEIFADASCPKGYCGDLRIFVSAGKTNQYGNYVCNDFSDAIPSNCPVDSIPSGSGKGNERYFFEGYNCRFRIYQEGTMTVGKRSFYKWWPQVECYGPLGSSGWMTANSGASHTDYWLSSYGQGIAEGGVWRRGGEDTSMHASMSEMLLNGGTLGSVPRQ